MSIMKEVFGWPWISRRPTPTPIPEFLDPPVGTEAPPLVSEQPVPVEVPPEEQKQYRDIRIFLWNEATPWTFLAEYAFKKTDEESDPVWTKNGELYFWCGSELWNFPLTSVKYYVMSEARDTPKVNSPLKESPGVDYNDPLVCERP